MDLAWAAGEPGPRLDTQALPGFRELGCQAVEPCLPRKGGLPLAPHVGSCREAWSANPSLRVPALSRRSRQHPEHVGLRLEETPSIWPGTGSSWPERHAFKITQMN